jgi:hypothetical protein
MGSFGEMMDRFNRHHHLTKELIHDPSYANPAILILKTDPIFCRLSVGKYGLHINEGDRNSSILDKIVGNCLMTNCCRHLSRSPFAQHRAKIRIAGSSPDHPLITHSSLSHWDFWDRQNAFSYTIKRNSPPTGR